MIFRVLATYFSFFCCSLIIGQTTYLDTVYDLFGGTEYSRAIFEDSSGYYTVFGATQYHSSGFKPCMIHVDSLGNRYFQNGVSDTVYDHGLSFTNSNFLVDKMGGYFYGGFTINALTSEKEGVAIRFDNYGDTLYTKRFPSSGSFDWYINAAVQWEDSTYILAGGEYISSQNSKALFVKLDKNGELVWDVQHGTSSDIRHINGLVTGEDGFIGGGYHTVGSDFHPYLCKVDTLGNLIWQQTLPFEGGIDNIKKTSDGNYMGVGYYQHFFDGNTAYFNCLAYKFNESGGVVWSKNFGRVHQFGGFLNFLELKDGNYLFVGSQGGEEEVALEDAFIVKTNANGDSLWARVNDRCGMLSTERYVDVIERANGGFIVSGSFWMGCTPDFWLVGLDSVGCHYPGCDVVVEVPEISEESLNTYFEVYPNPGTNVFYINSEVVDFVITVYDITGVRLKHLKSPAYIDLEGLASGVYTLAFSFKGNWVYKKVIKQ